MEGETERDTSRTVVQTYVPAYQRDLWDEHAEELGMSRSEFVKVMVQAGRREFGGEIVGETQAADQTSQQDLESAVTDFLAESGAADWDELLSNVTGDIETRLDETLQDLQDSGRIRYSGREGGYVLTGADNE